MSNGPAGLERCTFVIRLDARLGLSCEKVDSMQCLDFIDNQADGGLEFQVIVRQVVAFND